MAAERAKLGQKCKSSHAERQQKSAKMALALFLNLDRQLFELVSPEGCQSANNMF
jgi:hypothetical protein